MSKWKASDLKGKGLNIKEPFVLVSPEGKKVKGDALFLKICKEWGLNPIPEYEFAKDIGRKWRSDYFFEENGVKVALEIEGGLYNQKQTGRAGGHTSIEGFKSNIEKYNTYSMKGIFLYRALPEDLYKIKILEDVKTILKNGRVGK